MRTERAALVMTKNRKPHRPVRPRIPAAAPERMDCAVRLQCEVSEIFIHFMMKYGVIVEECHDTSIIQLI